jgi:hypothetical protein
VPCLERLCSGSFGSALETVLCIAVLDPEYLEGLPPPLPIKPYSLHLHSFIVRVDISTSLQQTAGQKQKPSFHRRLLESARSCSPGAINVLLKVSVGFAFPHPFYRYNSVRPYRRCTYKNLHDSHPTWGRPPRPPGGATCSGSCAPPSPLTPSSSRRLRSEHHCFVLWLKV